MLNFISSFSDISIALAGALALAVLVYWMTNTAMTAASRKTASKGIQDFMQADEITPDAKMGSAPYKIRTAFAAFGIDAAGQEETVFYTAWAALGALTMAGLLMLNLNLVIALGASAAIGYLPAGFGFPAWISLLLGIGMLVAVLVIFGKKPGK